MTVRSISPPVRRRFRYSNAYCKSLPLLGHRQQHRRMPVGLRTRLQPWLNEVRRRPLNPHRTLPPSVSLLPPAASLSPWETLIVDELAEQVEQWLTLWAEVQRLNAFLDGEPLRSCRRR